MLICKNCGKEFSTSKIINGKLRILNKRKYCLECSPFNSGNKIRLEDKGKNCVVCGKKLTGNQRKFCSKKCKSSFYGKYKYRSQKRRQSSRKSSKKWREKLKKEVDSLLGIKCIICGRNYKLISHKKDGIPHNGGGTKMAQDVIANPEQFVRVCWNCHKGVHWCMTYLGWSWKDIQKHLSMRKDI